MDIKITGIDTDYERTSAYDSEWVSYVEAIVDGEERDYRFEGENFTMEDTESVKEAERKVKEYMLLVKKRGYEREKAQEVEVGASYKHFKTGDTYKVICISQHTETGDELATYTKDNINFWARPKDMFESYTCDSEGNKVPRLQKVEV